MSSHILNIETMRDVLLQNDINLDNAAYRVTYCEAKELSIEFESAFPFLKNPGDSINGFMFDGIKVLVFYDNEQSAKDETVELNINDRRALNQICNDARSMYRADHGGYQDIGSLWLEAWAELERAADRLDAMMARSEAVAD